MQSCPPGAISAIDELPDDLGHLCAIACPRSINQWRGCVHHLRSQQATRIALQGCASALAPQQTGVLFHSFHVVSASEGSAHHRTFFLPAVGEPLATCCVTAAFASVNSWSVSTPSACSCFSSRSSPARLMLAWHGEADALARTRRVRNPSSRRSRQPRRTTRAGPADRLRRRQQATAGGCSTAPPASEPRSLTPVGAVPAVPSRAGSKFSPQTESKQP